MRKRICSMVIVLAVFLSLVPQCFAEYAENGVLELFVDSKASGGDGSFAAPFSSFEEARDYIRTLKANGQYPEKGVTVNFRGGTYYLNAGLKLTAEDSGTESAPITYRSYGNERAEFVGGASLKASDFKSVKTANPEVLDRIDSSLHDKIKVVDLHDYGLTEYGKLNISGWQTNVYTSQPHHPDFPELDELAEWLGYTPNVSEPELIVDGETMTLARYPNGDEMSTIVSIPDEGIAWSDWNWREMDIDGNIVKSIEGPIIPYEDMVSITVEGDTSFKERVKKWSKAPDIWAYGYWKWNWADLAGSVKYVDGEAGTLTMHTPVYCGAVEGQKFYVYNLLEELDIPGEWYLERETGKLYLYPKGDVQEIMLSLVEDNLLDMQNVNYVNIRKLDFSLGRQDGIELTNCKNVDIELCNVGNFGNKGIICNGDCRNINIISNYLYDLGAGGIQTTGGNTSTGEYANNLVENNWVYRYCRKGGQSAAVYVAGVGDVGRHNKIHESDGGAVIGGGAAYTVLEYNEVFDVMKKAADAGVSYSYQSVAVPGKEIRNNYFHDIHSDASSLVMGIYVDGMGHGHTVTSNIFENVDAYCVWFNGGWGNVATNNIFINCNSEGRYTSIGATGGEGATHEKRQVAEVTAALESNPDFKKYTWMQDWLDAGDGTRMIPQQNVFKDNVRVNTDEFLYASYSNIPESDVVKNNDIQKSLSYDGDPGFENMGLGNYALKESSDIYSKIEGFNAPEFKKMGLYTPWLAYKLKGTLALAIDSQTAYKDFDETYIDAEDRSVVPTIVDDLTYLPIRFIAENNGGDADFDEESGTATILLNGSEMIIDLKNKTISVNGELLEGYAPIIRGGRSLIPVRALEAMGKTVTWYGDQRVVIISDGEAVLEQEETELLNELKRRLS